ncbi:MAG: hypothetical protein QMD80_07695 [archaeon]|nr:hypothetical protein [archaeon]
MLGLYNSLTRKLEPFGSLEQGTVKMFTCGSSISYSFDLDQVGQEEKVTSEDAQHIITTLKNIGTVLQVFLIL